MASLNHIVLIGRVVARPELKYTTSGTAFVKFSIAVDRKFSKNNETDFIPCVAWSRLAEICNQYLDKGKLISATGRLQYSKFEDKDGNKRTMSEVVVEDMQMLSRGGDRNAPSGGNTGSAPANSASDFPGPDDIGIDDVPF